jgi:uncharacterized protein
MEHHAMSYEPLKFYAPVEAGRSRRKTPEGFLVIEGVPLARIGDMLYGAGEVPVPPGPDGFIHIARDAEDVFRDITIASINGKPVTDDHPDVDVDPRNWRDLAKGYVMNARRGDGVDVDFLLGDVMITDIQAIEQVESGKKELSCGYDADYETLAPGRGRQRNILYNHLALVDKGRCGPRCSIGDRRQPTEETDDMRTLDEDRTGWAGVVAKVREAFTKNDKGLLEEALRREPSMGAGALTIENHVHTRDADENEDEGKKTEDRIMKRVTDSVTKIVGDAMKAIDERIDNFEKEVKDTIAAKDKDPDDEEKTEDNEMLAFELEAPPGTTGDVAAKAKDSALFLDSFQETIALAEIITPGIRLPTYDRALAPKKTVDAICGVRRKALEMGMTDVATRGLIEDATGGREIDFRKATCDSIRTLFLAVGGAKKRLNNGTRDLNSSIPPVGGGLGLKGPVRSPADFNARMRAKYAPK